MEPNNQFNGWYNQILWKQFFHKKYYKKIDKLSFEIIILAEQDCSRESFSIVHELGHLFLHMGFRIDNDCWQKQILNKYSSFRTNEQEYQANEFAYSLLMPKSTYSCAVVKYSDNNNFVDINKLAKSFNLSSLLVL